MQGESGRGSQGIWVPAGSNLRAIGGQNPLFFREGGGAHPPEQWHSQMNHFWAASGRKKINLEIAPACTFGHFCGISKLGTKAGMPLCQMCAGRKNLTFLGGGSQAGFGGLVLITPPEVIGPCLVVSPKEGE